MGIFSRRPKKRHPNDCLQLIIRDAFSSNDFGSVTCLPPDALSPPFSTQWTVNGVPTDAESLHTDASGMCATRIPPGRIAVSITDRVGNVNSANAFVGIFDFPVIKGYDVVSASHATARDGKISAIVEHPNPQAKYLWSNGVVTSVPTLEFVTPGMYMVACVDSINPLTPVVFVHASPPALVSSNPTDAV